MKSIKRICLLVLLAVIFLVLGIGLLSPVLLQWTGARVAGNYGISWEKSSAEGYASLHVEGFEIDGDGIRVRIDALKLPQPGPWLLSRAGVWPTPMVRAGSIEVLLQEGSGKGTSDPVGPEILETIRTAILHALPWLPDVEVNKLEVVGTDGRRRLAADSIRLSGRSLTAVTRSVDQLPALTIRMLLTPSGIRLAAATGTEESLHATLLAESDSRASVMTGRLVSQSVPLNLKFVFGTGNWRPKSARLEASGWPVPQILIPEKSPIHIAPILDIDAGFADDSFQATLRLDSPETGPRREAASADIDLSGDMEFVDVNRFRIKSDWLKAELSQSIRYNIRERRFSGEALFKATAVLDRQSWIPASGAVEADVEFRPDVVNIPELEFRITGRELELANQPLRSISLQGALDYPELSFEEIVMEFPEDSRVEAAGDLFLDSRKIDGELNFRLSPGLMASLVPAISLGNDLTGKAAFEGTLAAPMHSGLIEPVELELGGLHPLRLSAEWAGEGIRMVDVLAKLESGPGGGLSLVAEIKEGEQEGKRIVKIAEADLFQSGRPILSLEQPVSINMDFESGFPLERVTDFSLRGEAGHLSGSLDLPGEKASLVVGSFYPGFLGDWLLQPVPSLVINSGNLVLDDLDPFLAGTFALQAHSASEQLELLSLALAGTLSSAGVRIESLEGLVDDTAFVRGNLELPFRIGPPWSAPDERFLVSSDGSLNGSLDADITRQLAADFPGIPHLDRLAGTHIDLEIGGSLEQPSGTVNAYLSTLPGLFLDPRLEGYQIEQLTLSALLEPDVIRIDVLSGKLREAVIEANGLLQARPLVAFLTGDEKDWRVAFRKADLSVGLSGFRADAFASLLPGYLRPTGQLAADLRVKPGPHLGGELRLENFSLRPTLYTQTIDDINVVLDLDGTRLSLDAASASVADSKVTATGFVDIRNTGAPLYRLEIRGRRTPLVRTPDLLLHADVDLVLDRPETDQPGVLRGDLAIRDSVLLMDIDPLAARTAGRGMAKPPFFRVPVEPFSSWELDIQVTGEDALRFRSQYAKALLSVNMSLDGTLGSPVLVGDIFSTDGQIQFPGTSMQFSRSELFVTREQQQTLQLDLNATSRTASTIITMRVGGSVEEPQVEFTSTPALSNAQILNLLATGSLERGGAGNIGLYLGKGLLGPGGADEGLLDRLSVEIGRDVSETGENTIDLYLNLTERLRLHGEYDKYDDQNLNLEWKVFSK